LIRGGINDYPPKLGDEDMTYVDDVLKELERKNPYEPEFIQTATEILRCLNVVFERHPEFKEAKILERFLEPERVVMFRVPWVDDNGEVQQCTWPL